jgi:FkbM family methyltransferase
MMDLSKIAQYFTPNTILDIGAHKGEFHQIAKTFFPNSYIFSIEGNKRCEPYLQQICDSYLIRYLGKERTRATLFKTTDDLTCTGDSIYKEVTLHYSGEKSLTEEIELRTIDDTFQEVTNFDLIKLDTQGSELDILTGGPKLAKKAKGILMEVSLTVYNEGAPLYKDVVKFMDDYGFIEKETLDEISWTRDGLTLLQRDILFINKNLLNTK